MYNCAGMRQCLETLSNGITYPRINALKLGAGNQSLHDAFHEWPVIVGNVGDVRKIPLRLGMSLNSLRYSQTTELTHLIQAIRLSLGVEVISETQCYWLDECL